MECHGCKGLGWVDSRHTGPTVCPICRGTGRLEDDNLQQADKLEPLPIRPVPRRGNKNALLTELEDWLQQQEDVTLDHANETMNNYRSWSEANGDVRGLVWVSTRGDNRIYLRKGDYGSVDSSQAVRYKTSTGKLTWGGYPQFSVKNRADLSDTMKLIEYGKRHL